MHRLSSGFVTFDSSVVVDFHLTSRVELLRELFADRISISDFVEKELAEAQIQLPGAEIVTLQSEDEWNFFSDLRKKKPGLGLGELGALTVAQSRGSLLLTNDKQARQTAEALGIPCSGGIGILEYAVEIRKRSGEEAVRLLEDTGRGADFRRPYADVQKESSRDAITFGGKIVGYTREEIDLIFESTNGRCHLCWSNLSRRSYGRTWEVDHSVPRSRGGSNYGRNLRPACIACNRSKGDRSSSAARRQTGHRRSPLSKSTLQKRRLGGALMGVTVGALWGPLGSAIGAGIGYIVGGKDDDS